MKQEQRSILDIVRELTIEERNKTKQLCEYQNDDSQIWTILFLDSHNHSVSKCFKTRCGRNSIGYLLGKLNKVCKEGDSYIAIVEVE